jgi:hypothetical protein
MRYDCTCLWSVVAVFCGCEICSAFGIVLGVVKWHTFAGLATTEAMISGDKFFSARGPALFVQL